jgi:hypothetical protein
MVIQINQLTYRFGLVLISNAEAQRQRSGCRVASKLEKKQ